MRPSSVCPLFSPQPGPLCTAWISRKLCPMVIGAAALLTPWLTLMPAQVFAQEDHQPILPPIVTPSLSHAQALEQTKNTLLSGIDAQMDVLKTRAKCIESAPSMAAIAGCFPAPPNRNPDIYTQKPAVRKP